MDLSSAFLLGALQGVTEVLPISSSGHLVIGQHLLGIKEPELFFDVCLHIGSLLAVLVVFREGVTDLMVGAFRLPFTLRRIVRDKRPLDSQEKTFLLVMVGTLPAVCVGLFARHFMESLFSSVMAVSINLIITGTFLWLTRHAGKTQPKLLRRTRWQDALGIGIMQSMAIAPGISRSGATITAGLFLGLDRDWAGQFSFLLFVPAVVGALILEASHVDLDGIQIGSTVVGIVTAAVSGYIALKVLLGVVRRGSFYLFAPYCWLLGVLGILWTLIQH